MFQSLVWKKVNEKGMNLAIFVIGDVNDLSPIVQAMPDPKKFVIEINYGGSENYASQHYIQSDVIEPDLLLNRFRGSETLSEALHMDL